ncbi:hypothetical protein, partial [Staphylococcus aureus]
EQTKIEIYTKLRKSKTYDHIIGSIDELIVRFNNRPVEYARSIYIVITKIPAFDSRNTVLKTKGNIIKIHLPVLHIEPITVDELFTATQ